MHREPIIRHLRKTNEPDDLMNQCLYFDASYGYFQSSVAVHTVDARTFFPNYVNPKPDYRRDRIAGMQRKQVLLSGSA